MDNELRAYVEMATDEKIAAGVSASEARRTTLAEFGGVEQVKQSVRDHRAGTSLEAMWQDVRYGWRQLMRNPGFTAAVIVTLALSIGANTAIFSIVNALMLKSLPYPHPERIGTIFWRIEGPQPFDGMSDIERGTVGAVARQCSLGHRCSFKRHLIRGESAGRAKRPVCA